MVGTNLKTETTSLMEKRSALEAEMNAVIDRLCRPDGPGLSGNLVDSEGFPRSDIDIPMVRAERRRLSELRNDHKEITDKINGNIQLLHSARLSIVSTSVKDSDNGAGADNQHPSIVSAVASASLNDSVPTDSPAAMNVDVIVSRPFAIIDEITDSSPAAEDGLQLGDQVVKFGKVEAGDNLLERLANESQTNQGNAVPVAIIRQGAPINLTVTPRVWQGRGLLGCHFRIL
ncbi:26S proteasome non-ATPase regulatory subunit 9 [Melia azedarach]|uniref:26S proteasome non-ATPase regulatory subunit 9 n=1 Tax=Melia azedarach TaxID=155640 RepID=A0ACC1XEN8_MELAZ|nr:26S proteasome non-ATPase regulatory subunit 9 [Melia azedarach]